MFRKSIKYLLTLFYPLAYFTTRAAAFLGLGGKPGPDSPRLVIILPKRSQNWILQRFCLEIAKPLGESCVFHHSITRLPAGEAYFFPHYSLFVNALKLNPVLWKARSYVWYTHPRDIGVFGNDLRYALNQSTMIISGAARFIPSLSNKGVQPQRITSVLGAGYSPDVLQPHQRLNGSIGFCSAYYERKNPDLIFELVEIMPHRQFILLGKGWKEWDRFKALQSKPNFTYIETSFENYPKYYAKMDVFVSPSKLEGGPVPLLEAMVCNAVPVASDTGFADELIQHNQNGYLFELDASAKHVAGLVELACQADFDVCSTVKQYTWDRFAKANLQLMELD